MAADQRPTDQRDVPLDIRDAREQPDVDERELGFQNIEGPGAGTAADGPSSEEDFGIPGSEEAGGLGTGPLPAKTPQRRQDGREQPRPERSVDDRIIDDRNVAVDGGRDRD